MSASADILQPAHWARPRGYANGVAVGRGRQVFIAGMIGWDADCVFHSDDFAAQARQALANIVEVLRAQVRFRVQIFFDRNVEVASDGEIDARSLARSLDDLLAVHVRSGAAHGPGQVDQRAADAIAGVGRTARGAPTT